MVKIASSALKQKAETYLSNISARNSIYNAFVALRPPSSVLEDTESQTSQNGPLSGSFYALKDNFCTTELPTTCASMSLKGYMSPYKCTANELLNEAGSILIGKTNMDEFGMGSNNTASSLYSPAINPIFQDAETNPRSAGGSSGGSAAAVAAKMCDFALGSDTGGSVRLPAAYCGIVGFKPSYGLISRHGLVAYAQSFDTVGILSRDVKTSKSVFDVLNKHDSKDPTSLSMDLRNKFQQASQERKDKKKRVIGVVEQTNLEDLDDNVRQAWIDSLEHLRILGHEIVTVSIPSLKHSLPSYFVIAPSEASSNLARYDGIRYGYRADQDREGDILYAATRNQGFGKEVQRRILLGVFNLSSDFFGNHFQQAQRVRRKIQLEYNALFSFPNLVSHNSLELPSPPQKVDVLISPTSKTIAPTHKEIFSVDQEAAGVQTYVNDVLTVPASIAGLPAISVPWGRGPNSVGIQVIGQIGDDNTVLDIAQQLEVN